MDTNVVAYVVYLIISIAVTVWVAQTLFRRGRVFLIDVFNGKQEIADSVNHLLVVGFYLINLGYICLELKIDRLIPTPRAAFEDLASKIGFVMVVLGIMHFMNLFIFSRMRRRAALRTMLSQTPPQPPASFNPNAYPGHARSTT